MSDIEHERPLYPPNTSREPGALNVVTQRSVKHLVFTWVVLAIAALVLLNVAQNERFQWAMAFKYFVDPRILNGVLSTLELTAISMLIGVALGTVLAVMARSRIFAFRAISAGYVGFFRGTPVLVQLIFWYNLAILYPEVTLGIPFGPTFFSVSTNHLIVPLTAAILGLGLNEAAYMAEIVRAGILAVDSGQEDAARALGMKPATVMRRIVLPQAMRVIVPPTGNQVIGMLKTTSVVSVIAMAELLYSAQRIYASNYQVIPLLVTISLWYLLLTSVLTVLQSLLERHLGRGAVESSERSAPFWKRAFVLLHGSADGRVSGYGRKGQ